VILANPPFMSPKGGIRPHNRFSVKSKRSEVLFVDYIAEHLTPNGRAGIIVPEGIIFQSQTAYKQLRKMLVEDYLVAVVSLPQGVFNPYSGVKTSILILDKPRAQRSTDILFVRIEDDGHDLGATRRRTGEGDLPEAARVLKDWCISLNSADPPTSVVNGTVGALLLPRQKIAASDDYRLTADTYRKIEHYEGTSLWVPLRDLLSPRTGIQVGDDPELPVLSITMKNGLVDQSDKFKKRIASADISGYKKVARNELVVGFPIDEGVLGIQTLYPFAAVSPAYGVWAVKQDGLDLSFFEMLLRSEQARARYRLKMRGTAGRRRTLEKGEFLAIEFPVPPLEVQKKIVAEIEGYQKVIDGARAVVDNYRPHIPIDPKWPIVQIGELVKPEYGFTASAADEGDARFIRITDIAPDGSLRPEDAKFITLTAESRRWQLSRGDILVARTGATYGKTMLFEEDYPAIFASYLIRLRFPKDRIDPRYYWAFAQSDEYWSQASTLMTGGGQPQFNGSALKQVKIPLPPLATQQAIVAEIEAEQALVAANHELIARFEAKIQATLARIWGEDEAAPAEA
jgi:type I restriction enzyme M protein